MIIIKVYSFHLLYFQWFFYGIFITKIPESFVICHGTTQKHLRVSAIFSKVLGLIFLLSAYKYV